MRRDALAAIVLVAGCAAPQGHACDAAAAEAELRAAHAAIMRAHLEGDAEAWLAVESDELIESGDGEIRVHSRADRRAERTDRFARIGFDAYEDTVAPVVRVAGDCSMGWVMVEMRASGAATDAEGGRASFGFRASWVELYRRGAEGWRLEGVASSVADED